MFILFILQFSFVQIKPLMLIILIYKVLYIYKIVSIYTFPKGNYSVPLICFFFPRGQS